REGTIVESFKDIECTMPDANGYDPVNNEVWRFKATVPTASVDEYGVLNIQSLQPAAGNGWTWADGILTISSDVDFKGVYILLDYADVKIVVTEDVVIDSRATDEEGEIISFATFSLLANDGGFEIITGDNTLTILNDLYYTIEVVGDLTISGNVVAENCASGWDAICASGNLIFNNANFYAENGPLSAWTVYDLELEAEVGGNIIINNSTVYTATPADTDYSYLVAMYAFGNIEINNSYVAALGGYAGITAENVTIANSTVSAFGSSKGIEANSAMSVDNSELMAESYGVAISVGPYDTFFDETPFGVISIKGVTGFYPETIVTDDVVLVDEYGDEYGTTTILDDEGNPAQSVWLGAANYAEYEIINGKLIITVVTETRINRVALYDADGKCIKTFNTYEVNEWGEYVWTIKMDAPTTETQYVIKGRDAAANSYKAGFTLPAITVEPEVVFESVEVETRGDKVYVIATTVSDNYDRVAVVNPVDGSYVKYTRNFVYDYETGKYVWTIFFDYVEGMDNLIVKARDIRTNHYNNAQAVEITVDEPVDAVIDISIEDYDENHLLVRVTTIPDLYRVKITSTDNLTGYIAYARNPVEMGEDAWVWEMIIERPTEVIDYAVDVAYEKAYARYYYIFSFVA
ncbi:MAG: hypothetical protein IKY44_04740, partial [Clostridia bacterium]|nr:hypothetical protein [Clostridia bacterium]